VIAVLARLRDQRDAVQRIVGTIARLEAAEREAALKALLILSGLRHLGTVVEQDARKVPILNDILEQMRFSAGSSRRACRRVGKKKH